MNKKEIPRKECLYCGKTFERKSTTNNTRWLMQKYCSKNCSSLSQTKRECLNCKICGKLYFPKNIRSNKRKNNFCSKECYCVYRKGKIFSDNHIKQGNIPWNKGLKGVSCGFPKGIANHKIGGENHYNWQGGITKENFKIRNSLQMKNWKRAVIERDNFTCVLCNKVGGNLHIDHIKPFAYYPELRFDINNGRVLCVECHRKTDTYAGKCKSQIHGLK